MEFRKRASVFVLFCVLAAGAFGNPANRTAYPSARSLGRIHIPWLGIGPSCTTCPKHYCDDDPAVIHGYCCGCARIFDELPVRCPPFLDCPANGYKLCDDYEYMMSCCCS